MKFEYTKIDLTTATREEIISEIARMKYLSNEWKNEEQAIKLTINSIYGAMGNKWLVCFNPVVAETVTLQGQDLIKFAEKIINAYFNKFWHLDTELHALLGLTTVQEVKVPVNIYSDTDSCYVCFEDVLNSCDWQQKYTCAEDFILDINKYRFKAYLQKQFDIYAKKWSTVNQQDFELENISETGIWLAKKKYILNKIWEDGIKIKPFTEIIYKGVELAQSSTPIFARKKLDELMRYILTEKRKLDKKTFTTILRGVKDEVRLADPETVSQGRSVNNYSKFILNDTTAFEVAKAPPIHVRAAGYHNYLLNKNPVMKQKYAMIKSGDKVKFYYVAVKHMNENDVFAYTPGKYPYEYAPPINYDLMFQKTILDPINRVLVAMQFGQIPPGLQIVQMLL
jgi:DNA polymerase elongation subunit (family B)